MDGTVQASRRCKAACRHLVLFMRGLTRSLWPIHYWPLPDELTSSWLVRLSYGMGLKVQTFSNIICGNRRQVWNRDIDRLAPAWLLDQLAIRTGTRPELAYATSLQAFEGALFPRFSPSGVLPWILNLKLFHRTRQAYGQQFCPACLESDESPYFRKRWRLAFTTFCSIHECFLHDRCAECAAPVVHFRMDFGMPQVGDSKPMTRCHVCGKRFGQSPSIPLKAYTGEGMAWLAERQQRLDQHEGVGVPDLDWSELAVLRHLVKLLGSRSANVQLHEHLLAFLSIKPPMALSNDGPVFEMREVAERHHLLQLGAWMMLDVERSLRGAWNARALRYNHMLKDFDAPPNWFVQVAEGMRNWRSRT